MVKTITLNCQNCGEQFEKRLSLYKEGANHFCNQSCANTYTNKHRPQGIRLSKLEKWINPRLQERYPSLDIHFNRKDAIESELDIYVPSLKLAFELNGELHYQPVFSEEHLRSIQENDKEKQQKCLEKGIELIVVDTSNLKYLTTKRGHRYLRKITEIIDRRLQET